MVIDIISQIQIAARVRECAAFSLKDFVTTQITQMAISNQIWPQKRQPARRIDPATLCRWQQQYMTVFHNRPCNFKHMTCAGLHILLQTDAAL